MVSCVCTGQRSAGVSTGSAACWCCHDSCRNAAPADASCPGMSPVLPGTLWAQLSLLGPAACTLPGAGLSPRNKLHR